MKEVFGDAWQLAENYTYLALTTNGFVKTNDRAVMGRGIARQAKDKYKDLDLQLGSRIKYFGNTVQKLTDNLIAFPVKHNWWEQADIELIKKSCHHLVALLKDHETCLLPRPGCGNGGLLWTRVKPEVESILDDRITIVHWKK